MIDVELLNMQTDRSCDPLELPYRTIFHATVATDIGVVTCGGEGTGKALSKCMRQTKNGQSPPDIQSFPSMVEGRKFFGMAFVDHVIFAISGHRGADNNPSHSTSFEWIDTRNGTEWTKEDLGFHVYKHCVTSRNNKIIVTGGYGNGGLVSIRIVYDWIKCKGKKLHYDTMKILLTLNHLITIIFSFKLLAK